MFDKIRVLPKKYVFMVNDAIMRIMIILNSERWIRENDTSR